MVITKYIIYADTPNGLEHPFHRGTANYLFNPHGYDTEQLALDEIERVGIPATRYLIVKIYLKTNIDFYA